MNDFEDRVRRGLHTDLPGAEEPPVAGVRRGATRRRRRRIAGAIGASVLVVAGAVGVATTMGGDERARPEPLPATRTPSPTRQALPEGAAQGVVDVSVVSADRWFRLTTNVGCAACSTVWQNEQSAEGGWERLHDFGSEAYVGEADPAHGPIDHLVMARNGKDGWAWGKRLYSTHDGGHTWARVTNRPGSGDGNPHFVALTGSSAWGVSFDEHGPHVYRTRLGADAWRTVPAPHLDRVYALDTVEDRIVLEEKGAGASTPSLVSSTDDGASWSTLATPCAGEDAGSPAALLCAPSPGNESAGVTIHRTTDFTSWSVLGHVRGAIDSAQPVADDRLLVVGARGHATLVAPDGSTQVDLPLAVGDQIGSSSWSGHVVYLTVYGEGPGYLITSTDGGRTWRVVP